MCSLILICLVYICPKKKWLSINLREINLVLCQIMIQIPNSLKQTLLIQDSKSAQASQCVEVSLLGRTDGFFWVVNVATYKVILTFQLQVCCMIG